MLRIHVTRPIPVVAVDRLREAGYCVTCPTELGLPRRGELLEAVREVDAILSVLTEKIDSELMDCANRLRVVSNMAVGFDNIDLSEAIKRGVTVCNPLGVLTETTADFTWALLMAVARRAQGFGMRVLYCAWIQLTSATSTWRIEDGIQR